MDAVDFVVNTYERTYADVLAPGRLETLAADHGHDFARPTVLINNVVDRADAERRASALSAAGELDAWFFVEDHIAQALERAGLGRADLGRAPYFVDWGLVAVTLPGPEWIVHCDPEVRLLEPCDWVAPSLQLMHEERRSRERAAALANRAVIAALRASPLRPRCCRVL